jgi:hypothetical protein
MIKSGDVLVDNDPRSKGRRVRIVDVGATSVRIANTSGPERLRWIARANIFEDDKPRRRGFSLVPATETP